MSQPHEMATLGEPSAVTQGAKIALGKGRLLILDRESPGEYVGWAILQGDLTRERDITVAEAIELAPNLRPVVITATIYAIAHQDSWAHGIGPGETVLREQSDRLIGELETAGVSRSIVESVAR